MTVIDRGYIKAAKMKDRYMPFHYFDDDDSEIWGIMSEQRGIILKITEEASA